MASDGSTKSKERKKKYIPGLAAFRFRAKPDWSYKKARQMFESAQSTKHDKIIYQDSIEGMKKLPARSISLVVADPPFGLDFSGKESLYNRDEEFVVDAYQEITGDYWQFSRDWISCLPRIMKKDASAYIFSGWTNIDAVMDAVKRSNLHIINHLIWKYQFGVFTRKKFVTSHYHILFVVKDPKKYFFRKMDHYPLDVWEINRSYRQQEKKNGTVLPIDLITRCIGFSSKPGDLVLDPFMGNGTTAAAAKGTWRHFLGYEINENLEPIIKANIESVSEGDYYQTYRERFPKIVEDLKIKYPKAYRIWKRNG